jgi:ABC-2 type transport system ATP-binding protein
MTASRSSSPRTTLEEADQLADRVALIDHGRLIADGSPSELKQLIPGGFIGVELTNADELRSVARLFPAAVVRDGAALTLQIPSDGRADSLHEVLDRLRDAAIQAERVSVHSPDLDEVFLALTGPAEGEGEER